MKKVLILILGIVLGVQIFSLKDKYFESKSEYGYIENKENMIHDIKNVKLTYKGKEFDGKPNITDCMIKYMIKDEDIDFMVYFRSDEEWDVVMFDHLSVNQFKFRNDKVNRIADFSLSIEDLKKTKELSFAFINRKLSELYDENQVLYDIYLGNETCDNILKNASH